MSLLSRRRKESVTTSQSQETDTPSNQRAVKLTILNDNVTKTLSLPSSCSIQDVVDAATSKLSKVCQSLATSSRLSIILSNTTTSDGFRLINDPSTKL